MTPSENCYSIIKEFEGLRLTSYLDQRGVWTVGYGHTGPLIGPGLVIDQPTADSLLAQDVSATAGIIERLVGIWCNQNQFDALVSLAYNIGQGAFRGSTLLRCINQRDMDGAAAQFLVWDKTNGETNPGLLRRRQAEQALFLS